MRRFRLQCCCPSFILAISGRWIRVFGAVMLDRPVVQPLTKFRWAENSPRSVVETDRIARVFSSLSISILELRQFYKALPTTGKDYERFDPHIRHFIQDGKRIEFRYLESLGEGNATFLADIQSGGAPGLLVVKFAKSYHAAAHQLLAQQGLAPKLLFVSSEGPNGFKVAGRSMVVMDAVQGQNLTEVSQIPDLVRSDIRRALDILHSHNLVFGDLRRPNVMVVRGSDGKVTGGMLIDFDWCGTSGQVQYPDDINPYIDWPWGVGMGVPILKWHDDVMFKRL
jgi:hypothetical protein